MIAFANATKPKYVADVVCPHCFRPLQYPAITGQGKDCYERVIRDYYGWCFKCERGFEVIQFKQNGRWLIHKYRDGIVLNEGDSIVLNQAWTTLNNLPDPAPVVTGPGGQYDTSFTPQTVTLLEALHKAMSSTVKVIEQLLKNVPIK